MSASNMQGSVVMATNGRKTKLISNSKIFGSAIMCFTMSKAEISPQNHEQEQQKGYLLLISTEKNPDGEELRKELEKKTRKSGFELEAIISPSGWSWALKSPEDKEIAQKARGKGQETYLVTARSAIKIDPNNEEQVADFERESDIYRTQSKPSFLY